MQPNSMQLRNVNQFSMVAPLLRMRIGYLPTKEHDSDWSGGYDNDEDGDDPKHNALEVYCTANVNTMQLGFIRVRVRVR